MTLETGIKFTTNLIVMVDQRKGIEQNKVAESLGARLGGNGEILVDDFMMSSIPGVYGVGSISGKGLTDSMSKEQGKVAAENSMGKKRKLNPEWVPMLSKLVQNVGYVGCSMKSALGQGFHPIEGINDDVRFVDLESDNYKYVFEMRDLSNLVNKFKNSESIKPEVFYNKNTRFDFLINKNNQNHFIEVKNVTLFRTNNIAEFPDAITSRGSKHIKTLIEATKKGYKSYVLYLVQIQNIENFQIAKDIDKDYYKNYLLAKKAGVQFFAYGCKIDPNEITIEKKLNIINE